jgi:hypothetical protein
MNKQVRKLSLMMLVLFLSVTAAFSQVTTSATIRKGNYPELMENAYPEQLL